MRRSPSEHELDLRVNELAQLFNSMDPTPFLNKDLDREAEAYIESWAMGLPRDGRLRISIHLGRMLTEDEPSALLTDAIHNYFEYKGSLARRELKQLLRDGRISLLIGLSFVTACLIGAEAIAQSGTHTAFTIARESLTIVGWVAMWRPLQTFLYDWWPLARRIRVYQNLSQAHVRVVQAQ